ncbi:MAG: sigma-70 family RNA polymerase sigma factor [Planctomycetota bacterium]|nr:MAG: sigma-70 family RNA polymerase sigma factor [Planctomycetota bacterium]
MKELDLGGGRAKARRFRTTHWSLVTAARGGSTPEARTALSELCLQYRLPVYEYIRRRGYTTSDADDLTQQFFAFVLEKDTLEAADPERGRFRCFLLGCINHFLADEADRSRAMKRRPEGGWLPLDAVTGEPGFQARTVDRMDPEKLYLRDWATAVIKSGELALEEEYRSRGRGRAFERLRDFIAVDGGEQNCRAAARELDTSETHVRVLVFRMRKRLRELVAREVAQTVDVPEDVEAELQVLLAVLRRD